MAIPPIRAYPRKTLQQHLKTLRMLAASILPWEWCFFLAAPFLFALVAYQRQLGMPRVLTGYAFFLLIPYVGVWFLLLEWVKRRFEFQLKASNTQAVAWRQAEKRAKQIKAEERQAKVVKRKVARAQREGAAEPAAPKAPPAAAEPEPEPEPEPVVMPGSAAADTPIPTLIAQATEAAERDEHGRALELWREVQARRPGNRLAASGIVNSMVGLKGPTSAEDLLAHIRGLRPPQTVQMMLFFAARALPADLSIGVAQCEELEARGEWLPAERRWTALRHHHGGRVAPHLGYIRNALAQGHLTEAERASAAALRKLPAEPELLALHATVAQAAGNWALASERWAALAARAPDYPDVEALRLETEARAALQTGPAPNGPAAALAVPRIDLADPGVAAELRELVLGFESLGRNCEFGLLQRACGAEPLGLLRFASTPPAVLVTLLNTRFAGVGEAADNEVFDHGGNEYWLRHKSSGWSAHTYQAVSKNTPEAVLEKMLRHTGYLRGKLLEDLEQQTKIFVYQLPRLTDSAAAGMFDALQVYGPNMLLCVRLSTDTQPAGHVEWLHERLMLAHIDREMWQFTGAGGDISVDYWIEFCRIAAARRAGLPMPAALMDPVAV